VSHKQTVVWVKIYALVKIYAQKYKCNLLMHFYTHTQLVLLRQSNSMWIAGTIHPITVRKTT